MELYSTNNSTLRVDLRTAVMQGLAPDGGLYLPITLPMLPAAFFEVLPRLSFPEIAYQVSRALLGGDIIDEDLRGIVERAINFPAPLKALDARRYALELFHGPSLAFKDFGARFMAELMGYFNRGESRELVILVATSGDTGGAVAAGFHRTPGIQVIILYPSGKVSALQEKQLTTLGDNIHALEIEGVFDDCQAMVKQAFLDADLSRQLRLSSANSINIARLVPQSFYYFEAYKQLLGPLVFSVPSGNFGNLTGGLIAKRMGLPIAQLIAATNINDVVPVYLREGIFQARASVPTISNAMDVGNPSNFARLEALFASPDCSTWNVMREFIQGYSFTDQQTKTAIKATYELYQYTLDPHGAVGLLALNAYLDTHPEAVGVFLETAHPAKFPEEVEAAIGRKIRLPPTLNALRHKEKSATLLPATYEALRGFLLDKFG